MLTTESSSVNAVVPWWRVNRTNTGNTTWKLKASVPTTVIITIGTNRSRWLRT